MIRQGPEEPDGAVFKDGTSVLTVRLLEDGRAEINRVGLGPVVLSSSDTRHLRALLRRPGATRDA